MEASKQPQSTSRPTARFSTRQMVMTALMAAVICVLAPMSIPIGEVPISLTNLAIYFILYILGWRLGSLSYVVYMLVGVAGAPVFSGFTGGLGKLLGMTGGYIIGFLPMAIIAGLAIDHSRSRIVHLLGMILGTIVCYALGTAWFCVLSGMGVMPALATCVFPVIPLDLLKMAAAIAVGPMLRRRIVQAVGEIRP